MLAIVESATVLGVNGQRVDVEVHVSSGLPGFTVVGLPDTSCKESRDRVRAAIISSGFSWPSRRITVNLAPSSVKKVGAGLDLAIAIGILAADEQISRDKIFARAFIGELGLDGSVRRVPGVISMVDVIKPSEAIVPSEAYEEASLISEIQVKPATNLAELVKCLRGEQEFVIPEPNPVQRQTSDMDLADVKGQAMPKLALEVAAVGGHNLLMVGPPGSGKSMLARRLPTLLPELDEKTALATTRIHSVAGHLHNYRGLIKFPPFRAPHHTMSSVALTGGGSGWIKPGEMSAAHGGVLFLDEMAEFSTVVLDALRQPLEEGVIRISRSSGTVSMPANFILVGAMNPCACGRSNTDQQCHCTQASRAKYVRRLSGPLLDRFDLRVFVSRPKPNDLFGDYVNENSAKVHERVLLAREKAQKRGVTTNSELSESALKSYATLTDKAAKFLEDALTKGRLSARGVDRIRSTALTLADLAGDTAPVNDEHVTTALHLRQEPFQEHMENEYLKNVHT